ncbi:hypothetical protein WG908_11725 [Sphingobium sp. AN641]|uniref:hypothetical protein n=1 Tax=Sphingobium sp. AN641 TaxID=3133443 RepID=UPI0030C381CD
MGSVEILGREVGGRTVAEWDKLWTPVPGWRTANTPELQKGRGIVRFRQSGKVMAIVRASDNKRGFVKKFSDYVRPSPSSRDHHIGALIYENRHDLTADIIVTGECQDMERVNMALKQAMKELYQPVWSASARP